MEKSYIQFQAEYPDWKPGTEAEEVLYNLSEYYKNSQIENSFYRNDSKVFSTQKDLLLASLKPHELEKLQQQYREKRAYNSKDRSELFLSTEPTDSIGISREPV